MEKRLAIVSEVLLWTGIVLGIITLMTMLIGTTTGATARWGFRGAITCATLAIACFIGSYLANMIYKDQQAEKEARDKAIALELANKKAVADKKANSAAKAKQKKLTTTVTTTEVASGNVSS